MEKAFNLILADFSNLIAFASLFIAILALFVTIIFNMITHRQYIESLNPLLSFRFIEHDGFLYLAITNTGQSAAKNIKVDIKELCNNGDRNILELDDLFNSEFNLFPNETVQGVIGLSGANIAQAVFPYINVDIIYIKGNDKKTEKYSRKITFSRTNENGINLNCLEDDINSVSYSVNRIANYLEGRTLFAIDRLNTFPHNSLYKDMKDAFNNIERKEDIK